MKPARFFPDLRPGMIGVLVCLFSFAARAEDHLWRSVGPAGASNITGVALDPTDPRIIYAVSSRIEPVNTFVRKSVDGGQTWTALAAGVAGLTCVAVDPSNPANVYLGTEYGQVASSHDAGATWTKAVVGAGPVSSIAVEPATGSVYAGMRPDGNRCAPAASVSRSTDGGTTWSVTNLEKRRGIYALIANPLDQTILAGVNFAWVNLGFGCEFAVGGGVAGTPDAGANWTLPSIDLEFPVTALAADPLGGVFAATESGTVFRSSGVDWAALGELPGTVSAIVVDPAAPTIFYAGLKNFGVWRSNDGGRSWRLFDSGLTTDTVLSLAIDPTGRSLYAGTALGVFHRDLPIGIAGTCEPGDDHLCLLGSRFRVDLHAIDPRTQSRTPVKALVQADRFGYFSFPSLTGDSSFPEVFVKMLDATSLPGQGYWLFSSSLTNVSYGLVVTDTTNGKSQSYDGEAFCGTADTHAFSADPLNTATQTPRRETGVAASDSVLPLLSGRFRSTLTATDPETGAALPGVAIPQADRFGYFSLPALTGDSTLPEVFVKMLDATSLADADFWLFQGGLTTVPYTLTVTDSVSGASKTYRNDPSDPTRLCGSADTRFTKGPTPLNLTGVWAGTYNGSVSVVTASVAQSGDRIEIQGDRFRFVGTAHLGILEGIAQSRERLPFREWGSCYFEGVGSGTATSSRIQFTSSESGTCGGSNGNILELTPVPE